MAIQKSFVIEVPRPCTAVAKVGSRIVGMATAWYDSEDDWVILRSEVRPKYRRRGIASAMYRSIELTSGKQLKPAVSLSDDAFEFWKSYRPEEVANDLRHRPELLGRKAQKNGRIGTIIAASGGVATIEYDDGNKEIGTKSCIRQDDLPQHLLPEEAYAEQASAE